MTFRDFEQANRGNVRLFYQAPQVGPAIGWLGLDYLRSGKPDVTFLFFRNDTVQLEESTALANADWVTFLANRGIVGGGGGGTLDLLSYVKKAELAAELLKYYTKDQVDELLSLLEQSLKDVISLAMQGAVQLSNKATAGNVVAGVLDKWVDAATLNGYTFSRGEIAAADQALDARIDALVTDLALYAQTNDAVLRTMKATGSDLTAGTADRWVDAAELKAVLDLIANTAPQVATADRLGVVRVGSGLSIGADGILSADAQDVPAGLLVVLDEAASNAVIADPATARIGDVVVFPGSMELPAGWANAAGKAVQAGDLATLRPNGTWQLMAGESAQEIIDLAFQNTQTLIQAYVNQLVAKADRATGEEVEGGVAGKWIDAATLRERLTMALQYVEDKFRISRPDGSAAQPGYVYTLRQVAGPPGSGQFTEYGWEPVPAGYAKLIDGKQKIIADDVAVDLLRFQGDGQDIESYGWAIGVRPSFATNSDRLMLAHAGLPDGSEVLTRQDGIDLLRVVQGWFVDAGLPSPALPPEFVRWVAASLRQELPPQNRMAPEEVERAIERAAGGGLGADQLAALMAVVTDPGWDGSDASLEAALPAVAQALNGGAIEPNSEEA